MSWTTPRTWVAGETVTAAMLNAQVRDNLNVISPLGDIAALTSYVPGISAVSSAMTLGTGGTITGAWSRIGGLVLGFWNATFGTTPTPGTGSYLVSVPTPASASLPSGSAGTAVGGALFLDASASTYESFTATLSDTAHMAFRVGNNTNQSWSGTTPAAPANGDTCTGYFSYWAA